MNYTFLKPLQKNGFYYIHIDTVKELEQHQKCSFTEICDKVNATVIGTFKSLSLIKIQYNGTKQQQPQQPAPAKPNVQRRRTRKRIANHRHVSI